MKKFGLLFSIIFLVCQSVWPQTSGDFRSVQSGDWNDSDTWERYNGFFWISSKVIPNDIKANNITIQNGHIVTITDSRTADQITINSGGQLTVSTGFTFTIADGTGVDLTAYGNIVNAGAIVYENTNVNAFVGSGSTYIHYINGGTIPTVTWHVKFNL